MIRVVAGFIGFALALATTSLAQDKMKLGKPIRNLRGFEVVETRGHIEKGQVAHWQVTVKVGFTLEE